VEIQTNPSKKSAGDGHYSPKGRKIAAWICLLLGVSLLIAGTFQSPAADLESKVLPAIIALLCSLLFWGVLTVQNIIQLLALLKGKGTEMKDPEYTGQPESKEVIYENSDN
jgi:hypothetical protein